MRRTNRKLRATKFYQYHIILSKRLFVLHFEHKRGPWWRAILPCYKTAFPLATVWPPVNSLDQQKEFWRSHFWNDELVTPRLVVYLKVITRTIFFGFLKTTCFTHSHPIRCYTVHLGEHCMTGVIFEGRTSKLFEQVHFVVRLNVTKTVWVFMNPHVIDAPLTFGPLCRYIWPVGHIVEQTITKPLIRWLDRFGCVCVCCGVVGLGCREGNNCMFVRNQSAKRETVFHIPAKLYTWRKSQFNARYIFSKFHQYYQP